MYMRLVNGGRGKEREREMGEEVIYHCLKEEGHVLTSHCLEEEGHIPTPHCLKEEGHILTFHCRLNLSGQTGH